MIYAIGDLHLSHSTNKPMDVFGEAWADHATQISANWNAQITSEDVVLLPGDISWAITLGEAQADLDFIASLSGQKVMIRGNHDYWWSGISKVRSRLSGHTYAIQNDALEMAGFAICGTRGWLLPTHPKFTDEDDRLYIREAERLKLSLDAARRLQLPILCMLHYPPCGPDGESTAFTELLEDYNVTQCIYGHLHGNAHRFAFEGEKNGVQYRLTSADFVGFNPVRVF